MSVCAAAPPPCLPLEKSANFVLKFRLPAETSNSRNVHPVSVTFRLFVYSAATFFAVSSARYDRIGPTMRCDARFGGSGRLCGATRDSADRRPDLFAEPPKSEKTGENRRFGEKIGTPGKCSKCPVLWCSTWNADKLFHVERR